MQIFQKQREGNIAELERSVALVPDNPHFHFELAVHYFRQGRDISAINEYKLAIALDPANAEYHRRLGDAYLKTGRYHEADEQFEIARRLELADENGP